MRRVLITGMGLVSPIGNTIEDAWQSIEQGRSGIRTIDHFDTEAYKVKLAAQVKDLDIHPFTPRDFRFNDRFVQFARIASHQAWQDSGLSSNRMDMDRVGVMIGSGIGGIETIEKCENALKDRGPSRVSPYFIPMSLINLAAGSVAIDLQAQGNCQSIVTACASGTNAIGEAFHRISQGLEDCIVAGGSEASITPLSVAGFQSMRALHTGTDPNRASIPFDKERSGFVMGEGAGILILEEYEHAISRNAKIYGEIIGYGSTCDAHHITAPLEDGAGAAKAMKQAVKEAKISLEQMDYINAHGTSTSLNDRMEILAIRSVFGSVSTSIPISSTKSYTGHCLGASGAVESVLCLLSMYHNTIPMTLNLQNKDEECNLDVVMTEHRKKDLDVVMNNSFGFGGHNASLIFKKWKGEDL